MAVYSNGEPYAADFWGGSFSFMMFSDWVSFLGPICGPD
jgi:hypothetical protein